MAQRGSVRVTEWEWSDGRGPNSPGARVGANRRTERSLAARSGIPRILIAVGALAATQCGGGPVTCESYANPIEVCARVDGARFVDGGTDAGDGGTADGSFDAAQPSDSASPADAHD